MRVPTAERQTFETPGPAGPRQGLKQPNIGVGKQFAETMKVLNEAEQRAQDIQETTVIFELDQEVRDRVASANRKTGMQLQGEGQRFNEGMAKSRALVAARRYIDRVRDPERKQKMAMKMQQIVEGARNKIGGREFREVNGQMIQYSGQVYKNEVKDFEASRDDPNVMMDRLDDAMETFGRLKKFQGFSPKQIKTLAREERENRLRSVVKMDLKDKDFINMNKLVNGLSGGDRKAFVGVLDENGLTPENVAVKAKTQEILNMVSGLRAEVRFSVLNKMPDSKAKDAALKELANILRAEEAIKVSDEKMASRDAREMVYDARMKGSGKSAIDVIPQELFERLSEKDKKSLSKTGIVKDKLDSSKSMMNFIDDYGGDRERVRRALNLSVVRDRFLTEMNPEEQKTVLDWMTGKGGIKTQKEKAIALNDKNKNTILKGILDKNKILPASKEAKDLVDGWASRATDIYGENRNPTVTDFSDYLNSEIEKIGQGGKGVASRLGSFLGDFGTDILSGDLLQWPSEHGIPLHADLARSEILDAAVPSENLSFKAPPPPRTIAGGSKASTSQIEAFADQSVSMGHPPGDALGRIQALSPGDRSAIEAAIVNAKTDEDRAEVIERLYRISE